MKYLLSWVCKHLEIDSWQDLGTIAEIIQKLTLHVSEISHIECIDYSENKIAFATVINSDDDICLAQYNDEKKVINLPPRKDAENGLVYIIVQQDDNKFRFATMKDFYAESKNHLMPALYGNVADHIAYVKKLKKQNDYVIKIDNTSISNRVDLLCHRGLARELGLLFNKKLISESEILFNKKNIKKQNKIFSVNSPYVTGAIASSGIFHERESFLSYILSMAPLDMTSHSYLIDLSNYVMLDVGQPMHIFDKQKIPGLLEFTDAAQGVLHCLDNTSIEIEKNHTVIVANNQIQSLVGIIGGKNSSVNIKTKEIIIESAAIKKEAIVYSAQWYNKRTESVIRNEKGSSVYAIEFALLRFLKLINEDFEFNISEYQFYNNIKEDNNKKILLSLLYLEKVIGVLVDMERIEKIFSMLGFVIIKKEKDELVTDSIEIQVPWWRHDIRNEDDLIEEIARHIGYDSLPLIAPKLECKGIIRDVFINDLKKNIILLTSAQEIISYGISNEEQKNKWSFVSTKKEVLLKNPYSDRQKYMASSFLPNFLDLIHKEIQKGIQEVSLFEINPLWHIKNDGVKEEVYYTFCIYEQNNEYDFYKKSYILKKIFYDLGYDFNFASINLSYLNHNLFSDIASHIYYDASLIGICGFIDPLKIYKENKKNGSVFAIEINLTLLLSLKKISLLSHKFPSFDISVLIKKNIKIASVLSQLQIAFGGIMHIKIIDWFESEEWLDKRSITLRIFLMNNNIGDLYDEIKEYLIERDCNIR